MLRGLRGREAPPAGDLANLAKTFIQAAIIWTGIFVLIPALVLAFEEAVGLAGLRFTAPRWRVIGAAIFLIAGSLNVTTACVMAVRGKGTPLPATCPRRLVLVGPFRHVRNPMALSTFTQGVGLGLFLGSPMVTAGAIGAALIWQWVLRPWEEADLEQRFGEPYRRYRAKVRCWLPHLRPYSDSPDAADASSV